MTTNLTIGADDWTALGAVPASVDFRFRLVNIAVTSGRVLSDDPWTIATDVTGSGTTFIPDSAPGNGLLIESNLRGFGAVTVASYPTGTLTLAGLLDYIVDPATLAPSTAPEAWWVALEAGGGGGGGGAVASVNEQTGSVFLTQDNITDGITAKQYTATEKTKLSGISAGATVNSGDATLLARANHTGTQSADTIIDGSTNHAFTAADDTKLAGIATGATANQSDATTNAAIAAKADAAATTTALSGKAATVHAHAQADVTNLTSDLALKAPLASPTFTGTVAGVTKTHVGLSNVDNTADANKPVSTAQAAADAAAQAAAVQRSNHTGTQSADTITDGTTNKAFTATERTKLTGIATGATANSADATLLARGNHTGTQTASTISDFATAADARVTAGLAAAVPNTGNSTVAGVKTFSSAPVVPDASFTIAKTSGLQSALDGKVTSTAEIASADLTDETDLTTGLISGRRMQAGVDAFTGGVQVLVWDTVTDSWPSVRTSAAFWFFVSTNDAAATPPFGIGPGIWYQHEDAV